MRRQRIIAQRTVFMLMPGIGELDRECADIRPIEFRQDSCHRNVVDMGTVIVTPADVQPDAVTGDALDAQIDGSDMQFQLPEEFGFPQMTEKPMPFHREIRAVDLQDQARVMNRPILIGQSFCQG